MLHRRKVLLYLLQHTTEPVSKERAQLLLFLFTQQSTSGHYRFMPAEDGPHSLVLEDDFIAMLKKGELIEQEQEGLQGPIISIKDEHTTGEISIVDEDRQVLDETLAQYKKKPIQELFKIAIKMKPFYGIHLSQDKALQTDKKTRQEIGKIQKTLKGTKHALYTIGYEKISLDEFILLLLFEGMQTVIDVRETTTSRRREFSKNPLELALNKAGIRYISMPEAGIPSEIRNEILKDGDHQDLLVWYRKNIQPKSNEYAKRVADALRAGNTSLMCYEKDPKECHRSVFAQVCKEKYPEIQAIIHLRDDGGLSSEHLL